MGKIRLDITEDSYGKNRHSAYELSILVGVDSFAYALADASGAVHAVREYQLDKPSMLADVIQTDGRLQDGFSSVRIGCAMGAPVLVPAKLYDEQEKKLYLSHLTELPDNAVIFCDEIPQLESVGLYVLPEWATPLKQAFPAGRFSHLATHLIAKGQTWPAPVNQMEPRLLVHVGATDILVLLFSGQRLVLCNAFPFQSAEDFLYYLLLTLAQEGFDNNQTPVYLSGPVVEDSAIYRIIYRFFRKTNFISLPPQWPASLQIKQQPAQFFFALLSLGQS